MSYAEKLREFADYLDNHPVLSEKLNDRWEHPSVYIYCQDWDEFQRVIKDLDGFTKSGFQGNLTARHVEEDAEGYNRFRVSVAVTEVCEIIPKVDENGEPVMRPKMKSVPTGEFEQEVEYKCPDVWTSSS